MTFKEAYEARDAEIRKQIAHHAGRMMGVSQLLTYTIKSEDVNLSNADTLRTVMEALEDNMKVLDGLEDELNMLSDNRETEDAPPAPTPPKPKGNGRERPLRSATHLVAVNADGDHSNADGPPAA